jgi:PAS domain S-box-containing protein
MLEREFLPDTGSVIEQMAALARVSQKLSTSPGLNEVLQTAFQEALANSGADGGQIGLYHASEGIFIPHSESGIVPPRVLAAAFEKEVHTSRGTLVRGNLNLEYGVRSILMTPILYEGVVIGVITLTSGDHNYFDDRLEAFLQVLANQVAVAVGNAQMLQDTLQRERFYGALGRVTLAINSTVNLPTVLSLICRESLALFTVDGAYFWQVEGEELVGIAADGYAREDFIGSVVPLDHTEIFAADVAQRGEGLYANDYRKDKKYTLRLPQPTSVESVLGIPLRHERDIMGVLVLVDTREPQRFDRQDLEQAGIFGAQATIAIKNAQLVTEMRELNEQLDERVAERTHALGEEKDRVHYLLRVTAELSASLDQDRVLVKALEFVNEVVQATHGSILLLDPLTRELIYPAAFETHKLPPLPRVDLGVKPEEGLAGWIIKNREAVVIDDTQADERWNILLSSPELRSVMAVPLVSSNEVIGALTLFHKEPYAFSQEQLDLVEAAAIQVASAISNAQLYLLIRDQAERLGRMLREEHIEAAKNQAILESIADGVLVADASGKIILANLSASQILDIPRSQLIGKSFDEMLGLYASTGDAWRRAIQKWEISSAAEDQLQSLAERLTIEDRVVSMHFSPVFANDQFSGTVSIFRDVTKEVEVDRMKSEFVSTVSHELRTPMTSIKGYAELMLTGGAGSFSDVQENYLDVIRNNADRMSDLVDDLLDISRIESGTTELNLEPVNIAEVISQVIDIHLRERIRRKKKPVEILTNVARSLPKIYADQARITQIMINLLDNALYYTPDGGRISVRAHVDGDFAIVTVEDSGIGISEDDQKAIFERFYRSERVEVQRVPGTGLGLSIVRSLTEMHGGTIEVESTLGEGSAFRLKLPLYVEVAASDDIAAGGTMDIVWPVESER